MSRGSAALTIRMMWCFGGFAGLQNVFAEKLGQNLEVRGSMCESGTGI